jgi:hypothetical protein
MPFGQQQKNIDRDKKKLENVKEKEMKDRGKTC